MSRACPDLVHCGHYRIPSSALTPLCQQFQAAPLRFPTSGEVAWAVLRRKNKRRISRLCRFYDFAAALLRHDAVRLQPARKGRWCGEKVAYYPSVE
jgi:hypothetical protein